MAEIPEYEVVRGPFWAYRCRTQIHTRTDVEGLAVGYRGRRSHDLVAVDSCPVLVPDLEKVLSSLGANLGDQSPRRVDLLVGDAGALTTAPVTADLPHGPVEISVGEFSYELDARCFFQAHSQLLPELVKTVIGEWRGEQAVDLYAGVGLFSLPLARNHERVIAVESDRVAARYTRQNAKRYGMKHLEVVPTAVESWIGKLPANADRVVVDPPRAGLSYRVREELLAKAPRRITYVSCHAAALARDLRVFLRDYRVERMTILDMFPQTGHIEVVLQLASTRV
jgi:23S rRNA (uracil1939-C5)-methyltransferase